jgi:hypothetical protein
MDNINYVNVNPLPDEVGGINQAGNTEEIQDPAINVEGNETSTSTETVSDEEAAAKAQELMRLMSDPNVLKAYRNIRSDVYGKKRPQVSKKDNKKKKAKRRMAKKSRRG